MSNELNLKDGILLLWLLLFWTILFVKMCHPRNYSMAKE